MVVSESSVHEWLHSTQTPGIVSAVPGASYLFILEVGWSLEHGGEGRGMERRNSRNKYLTRLIIVIYPPEPFIYLHTLSFLYFNL